MNIMKNFLTKKNVLLLAFLFITILSIVLVIVFTTTKPVDVGIRGSCVVRAKEYNSTLTGYEVGKFETYSQFKESKWANESVFHWWTLKEELYNREYFKDNNLVIIEFNSFDNHFFTVVNVTGDNRSKEIQIVERGNTNEFSERATYYCLYETKEPLSSEYTLKISERLEDEGSRYLYISEDNEIGLFFEEECPVIYRLKTREDVEVFLQNDPIITANNYAYRSLNVEAEYNLDESDMLLIRCTMNEFDSIGINRDDNRLRIWKFKSNHYTRRESTDDNISILIRIFIPKEQTISMLSYETYYEYEGSSPHIEIIDYKVIQEESDELIKYYTEIQP